MKRIVLAVIATARVASAQPAAPPDDAAPLAELRDDAAIAKALTAITQDPAITVDDPQQRALAQALMVEGVRRLKAKEHDQALANFLEAYGKFPSPRILLNVASTLRVMGRLSDAANTYQRYLLDPVSGDERIGEVKAVLTTLDQELTVLTVRVTPPGASLSIDAGPFIPVGGSLQARIRPGIHLVRIKHGDATDELTVNGFPGELKEIQLTAVAAKQPDAPTTTPPAPVPTKPPPETVNAWLDDSQRYGTSDTSSNQRFVFTEPGVALPPFVPRDDRDDTPLLLVVPRERISSGLLGVLRIDAEGRGFAGGLGIAISRGHFEADALILRSNQTGAYLGARYRFMTNFFRPYVQVGLPAFVFETEDAMGDTETRLALGLRLAAGAELYINGHLSVQADFGYEHFWFVDGTRFVADVLVPTVGVIGRL